jgi:hypothetical protein
MSSMVLRADDACAYALTLALPVPLLPLHASSVVLQELLVASLASTATLRAFRGTPSAFRLALSPIRSSLYAPFVA